MLLRLFLLFTVIPLIELALLVKLTKWTSLPTTILLVLITGALGAYLARREGIRALQRIQAAASASESPTEAMWDAALILVAGIVLITPGLLTDVMGFLLLLPPFRRFLQKRLADRLSQRITIIRHDSSGFGPTMYSADSQDSEFVDVHATSYDKPRSEQLQLDEHEDQHRE